MHDLAGDDLERVIEGQSPKDTRHAALLAVARDLYQNKGEVEEII